MQRFFLIFIALFVVASLPWQAQAQATDWTLDDYEQLVRETLAAAQRNDEIGVREAGERLISISHVQTPGGEVLPVDNSWLVEELDNPSLNMRRIREHMGIVVEVLTSARSSSPDDLQRLRDILSRRPYDLIDPNQPNRGFDPPNLDFFSFAWIGDCLVILGWLSVGGMIIYIIMMFRRNVSSTTKRAKNKAAELAPILLPSTSAKAIEKADQEAFSGDFRTAVRYLYLSTLLWLAERNALAFDRTLTNHEVLAALPPGSTLYKRLAPVIQTFDRVWYGFKEIDQAAFETYRQQVTQLREGRS